MNGSQSSNDPTRVQPGNAGDAGRTAERVRKAVSACVTAAWLELEEATSLSGDADLARAWEIVNDWLAREAGAPREGQQGREAVHGEASQNGETP